MPHRVRLRALVSALIGAAALMSASSALSQSIWIPRDRNLSVTIEAVRPSLEYFDQTFSSSVTTLTARIPMSSRLWLIGELPYAHLSFREVGYYDPFPFYVGEGSSIGNPYLGMEVHSATGPIFGEIGVRLPLASWDEYGAREFGLLADASRWEAFFGHAVSVQPAFNLREVTPFDIAYRLRLSPVLVIPTEGPSDTELFLVYAWQIGYEGRYARVGAGVSGRLLLTEDYGNLGQRTTNQLEAHADFASGPIRPGLTVRLPLAGFASIVPVVWGVSLNYVK